MSRRRPDLSSERGQASVEFLSVLPVALLLGAVVWQFALAGHTAWISAHAARSAARAEAVGRDGAAAARTVLPRGLERGLRVERRSSGGVRVTVRVPLLLPRWQSPARVSATAALAPAP